MKFNFFKIISVCLITPNFITSSPFASIARTPRNLYALQLIARNQLNNHPQRMGVRHMATGVEVIALTTFIAEVAPAVAVAAPCVAVAGGVCYFTYQMFYEALGRLPTAVEIETAKLAKEAQENKQLWEKAFKLARKTGERVEVIHERLLQAEAEKLIRAQLEFEAQVAYDLKEKQQYTYAREQAALEKNAQKIIKNPFAKMDAETNAEQTWVFKLKLPGYTYENPDILRSMGLRNFNGPEDFYKAKQELFKKTGMIEKVTVLPPKELVDAAEKATAALLNNRTIPSASINGPAHTGHAVTQPTQPTILSTPVPEQPKSTIAGDTSIVEQPRLTILSGTPIAQPTLDTGCKLPIVEQPKNTFLENSLQEQKNSVLPEAKISSDIHQGNEAILKDGYYEVNGFKFSEYYYNRLWKSGRGAPSLVTKEILELGKLIGPDEKIGFFKYETIDWELVYNPTTKEIWHLQPK